VQRAQADLRARADSFGHEAERYDRSRPAYPAALIDDIVGPDPLRLSVLDVECGTGIASRLLAERGAQVIGVDRNAAMAHIGERHGVTVDIAAFEEWEPAGCMFDRVTSPQGWHWLDPVVSTAKTAPVLHPGGRLCIFWSVGHHPAGLADALSDAYHRVLPKGGPILVIGYAANRERDILPDPGVVTDAVQACNRLAGLRMRTFTWSRRYTRDQWLDQLMSHSVHITLDPEMREQLTDEVGGAIDRAGVRSP